MLKLGMCGRRSFSLSVVAKHRFDSVLAKNHIFLNEARWARLENKTPREIMNMDRKTELKTLL